MCDRVLREDDNDTLCKSLFVLAAQFPASHHSAPTKIRSHPAQSGLVALDGGRKSLLLQADSSSVCSPYQPS